jgi:hypothetical protein
MPTEKLQADYVIVGAGAIGMAFADEMLEAGDADMIVVDNRHRPGGHWNDAYPFVRLHGATSLYGVNSRPLGDGPIDKTGLNAGLEPLPSGAEICAHFDETMRQRLLPSGRVTYLPMCDHAEGGTVTSRISGRRVNVSARKALVDATHSDTKVPATHPPIYPVAPEAACIAPNALPEVTAAPAGYTIIGAGKTAMDSVLWLLEQGVAPDRIRWIRPRDAWMVDRAGRQFGALGGLQLLAFAGALELVIKLPIAAEMLLDGRFAAAGDEDEVFDAGCLGLFHRILDDRLVDDGEQLLRHRLRRRQRPGSGAGHREHRLAHRRPGGAGAVMGRLRLGKIGDHAAAIRCHVDLHLTLSPSGRRPGCDAVKPRHGLESLAVRARLPCPVQPRCCGAQLEKY